VKTLLSGKIIIAFDFDNTIVETDFPVIKGLKEGAKEVINDYYNDPNLIIIIWTCRTHDWEIEGAKDFLKDNGINYHYFNENCPEAIALFKNDSRKIAYDILVDDKAIGFVDDWDTLKQMIDDRITKLYDLDDWDTLRIKVNSVISSLVIQEIKNL
jgi:FMN phosphatase YigB (HAD superfamily)